MNIFLTCLLLLPLFEIAGFIVIGGKIGLGASLLWLLCAGLLGVRVLQGHGGVWARVQTADDDLFVVEGMFDALCLLSAGLLLVFPGFISDFLALPLLVPPLRRLMFRRLRSNPDGFIRRHARFSHGARHGAAATDTTIIEAEYTEITPDTPGSDNARALPPHNG